MTGYIPEEIVRHIHTYIPYGDRKRVSRVSRVWSMLYKEELRSYAHPSREKVGEYWKILYYNPSLISDVMTDHGAYVLRSYAIYLRYLFSLPFIEEVNYSATNSRMIYYDRWVSMTHYQIHGMGDVVDAIIKAGGTTILSEIFDQFPCTDQAEMVEAYIRDVVYRPVMVHWLKSGGMSGLRNIDGPGQRYYRYDIESLMRHLKEYL